jgi:hypothetical protein
LRWWSTTRHGGAVLIANGKEQQKTVHLTAWRCGLVAFVGPLVLLKSCLSILHQRTEKKDVDAPKDIK